MNSRTRPENRLIVAFRLGTDCYWFRMPEVRGAFGCHLDSLWRILGTDDTNREHARGDHPNIQNQPHELRFHEVSSWAFIFHNSGNPQIVMDGLPALRFGPYPPALLKLKIRRKVVVISKLINCHEIVLMQSAIWKARGAAQSAKGTITVCHWTARNHGDVCGGLRTKSMGL